MAKTKSNPLADTARVATDQEARAALRELFEAAMETDGSAEMKRLYQAFLDSHRDTIPAQKDWSDKVDGGPLKRDSGMNAMGAKP